MEIRTKFNVGDKVWYIQCRKVNCAIITYIITETLAERSATIIGYELNTEIGNYREEDCFATKEEAQKECNRRNINCDECGDIDCKEDRRLHGIDFLCWLLGVLLVFLTAFLLALK